MESVKEIFEKVYSMCGSNECLTCPIMQECSDEIEMHLGHIEGIGEVPEEEPMNEEVTQEGKIASEVFNKVRHLSNCVRKYPILKHRIVKGNLSVDGELVFHIGCELTTS